jgi:hypothetical protein
MPRGKSTKLKPFQKLLTIMVSGKEVSIKEIDALLGKEIYMYRLSTYMWHIKTNANGVVKAIKDGRKVTAYQLCNVDEVKKYMDRVGVTKATYAPGTVEKKPSVSKLADLKAKPVKAKAVKPKVTKAKPAKPVVEEDLEVTEITE